MEERASAREGLGWILGNTTSLKEWSGTAWAAQEGGGVTDPGGVQGTFGRCVEGHGLVRTIGDGWMVGLSAILWVFSNLSDSMRKGYS